MTVSATTTEVSYTGDGSTTGFAVTFTFEGTTTTAELQVIERTIATGAEVTKANVTDYTVSGGNGSTGTVTAVTAPANTVEWHIRRNTTQTQTTDYVENDPFPAETHEDALDRMTRVIQEQQTEIDDCFKFPKTYTGGASTDFPEPVANTYLLFNAAGTALTTSSTSAAQFLGGDGTVSLPFYSFSADPDTGTYRIGANNLGIAVGGSKVVDVDSSGMNGVIGATTAAAGTFSTLIGTNVDGIIGANTPAAITGTTLKANTSLELATGQTVTGIADEDGMASNSSTLLASQQSIKAYVDALVSANGGNWKASVVNATTANITLSGEQTIDGTLTATSRILVKNQTDASENGIYVTAAGAWARAADFDAWDETVAGAVFVETGTTLEDTSWIATNDAGGTLDTTDITFTQFGSQGLANVAEDTSPQLGGFLDPDSNYIGMAKGGDIASASPLVVDTDGDYFDVTGTTGFAAMTVAANRHFFLQFDGALTMTHHATNLDLPGEANITTAAGDVAEFFSTGTNTVQCVGYTKADGTAVATSGGGAWTLIGTQVASGDASLTQTGLDSTYDTYAIVLSDLVPITDGVGAWMRFGDINGIDSGASDYSWGLSGISANSTSGSEGYQEDNADAQIKFITTGAIGNAAGEGFGGVIFLHRPGDGTIRPYVTGNVGYFSTATALSAGLCLGSRTAVITLDRVQFLFDSGNISTGRMSVYGISHT